MRIYIKRELKSFVKFAFYGMLTFLLYAAVFFFASRYMNHFAANLLAWFANVTASYFLNRLFVFKSGASVKNAAKFYTSRLALLFLEEAGIAVFIVYFGMNKALFVCLISMLETVFNYFVGKKLIFKRKTKKMPISAEQKQAS